MIDLLNIPTKEIRAFGWVQDSSNIDSLCDVVALFDSESDFTRVTLLAGSNVNKTKHNSLKLVKTTKAATT